MARPAVVNVSGLRDAYLASVRTELRLEEQAARVEAATQIAAAHDEAIRSREAVRREAEDAATPDVRRIHATGVQAARSRRLAAQQAVYRELCERSLAAVRDQRRGPSYDGLLDRLVAGARERLGDAAVIARDPEPDGGVTATADGRMLDLTLPALTRRCLEDLGPEIESLWS